MPELLLTWLHIGDVARQPPMKFDLQFCFERLRIHSRTHSPDQVQEVAIRSFQPCRRSINQQFRRRGQPKIRHATTCQLRPVKSRRSHANNRERMPVDLITGPNHREIRAVLVLPDVEAHHCHRRRALLIVRVGHQPADPRMHAKSPEEIAGHELAITSIRRRVGSRPADAERGIPGL